MLQKVLQYSPLTSINKISIFSTVAKYEGVALALVSTALFVVVGILVRILSENIDLFQILLFRQMVFLLLLSPLIFKSFNVLIKPKLAHLHLLRIVGAFLSLYLGFLTVSHIPLADATALGFTQVLFVAVISNVFLSESISINRVIAIIVGFIGVLLVVQPSFQGTSLIYFASGITGALGAAIAVVCVRRIAVEDSKTALLVYQAVFVGLMAAIPGVYVWQWPTAFEWLLLTGVGVISSLAQWIGVTAYQKSEANVVANVEYAKIIYAAVFGYFLFSEVPNFLAFMGISLLILSAFLPMFFSRKAS